MLTRNKIYVSTNNSKNITSSVKSHITIIGIKNKDNTTCVLSDRRSGKSKNNVLYLAGSVTNLAVPSVVLRLSHNALYFLCSDPPNFLSRILQGFCTRQGQGM